MGEIAARLADLVVLTSDNPRSEEPLRILEEIEEGVLKAGIKKFQISDFRSQIQNRKSKIETGLFCRAGPALGHPFGPAAGTHG